jgi:hypothetical protein
MAPRRRCKLLLGTDREPRSRGHGHAPLAVASRLHSCCSMHALPAPAVARRAAAARRHTPGWRQLALAAAAARLVVAGCRTAASASHTSRTGYDFHEWTLGRRRCRRERRDGRWGEDRCVLGLPKRCQLSCQNVAFGTGGTTCLVRFQIRCQDSRESGFEYHRCNAGIFYIYFITILQKYIVRHKFCKNIHLPPWSTASGT